MRGILLLRANQLRDSGLGLTGSQKRQAVVDAFPTELGASCSAARNSSTA